MSVTNSFKKFVFFFDTISVFEPRYDLSLNGYLIYYELRNYVLPLLYVHMITYILLYVHILILLSLPYTLLSFYNLCIPGI